MVLSSAEMSLQCTQELLQKSPRTPEKKGEEGHFLSARDLSKGQSYWGRPHGTSARAHSNAAAELSRRGIPSHKTVKLGDLPSSVRGAAWPRDGALHILF